MRISPKKPILAITVFVLASCVLLLAQAPAGKGPGGGKGPARPVLSITSSSFPDGGEIPLKNSFYGENKSPEFTFNWTLGSAPTAAPEALQSYAIIFHDIENATAKGPTDTLHWSAFNIPGSAKGLPEGLGAGDLPDGTRNGPGIAASGPMACRATSGPARVPVHSITTSLSFMLWTRSWILRRRPRATTC
jgi:hypothetical protein